MRISTQRIYDSKATAQGYRILVDRLWPRGISKEKAALNGWWKDLAPSTDLRKWFSHDRDKWDEFRRRYLRELGEREDLARDCLSEVKGGLVLLYGSRDKEFNHARVLKEYLEQLSPP